MLISFFIRLAGHLVRSTGELVLPHVWRQMDTLGVSFRYWLRFRQEHEGAVFFLPAALQSGDGNGVMPMEFPFLNFIFFPFWSLGPYFGKIAIYVVLCLIVYGLCWKLSKTKFWFSPAFLLLPVFSYTADYLEKFIPDVAAMFFVTFAVTYAAKSKPRLKLAFVLATLGLLIKPTAIVALGLLLFTPRFLKRIKLHLAWSVPAIAITGIYYTAGLKWIDQFKTGAVTLFYVAGRNPLSSLKDILGNPIFIADEFLNRLFFVYGFAVFALGILTLKKKINLKLSLSILFIIILQFLTISALDGTHVAQHDYYFMGIAPLACVAMFFVIRKAKVFVFYLVSAVILFHSIELSAQNMKAEKFKNFATSRDECQTLIARHPELPWKQAYVFRSNVEPYPSIGLCFGEREGSTQAQYGLFYPAGMPPECTIIDRTETFAIAKCSP